MRTLCRITRPRLSTTAALALVAGTLAAPMAIAQPQQSEQLELNRVTLYRSGVGFFQRDGLITDDADIRLSFDTAAINDILKSMVTLDFGGGTVASIGYGSKEPLAKRLAGFGVDISDNPSISTLLGRLRGARMKFTTRDGEIIGTVMGVEQRTAADGEGTDPVRQSFVNVLSATGLKTLAVRDLAEFEILDRDLAEELRLALEAIAEQRAENVKAVDVNFRGEGSRRVLIGYTHEMPVWKTSYRLVLPSDTPSASAEANEPQMQGWAIVENTTDEDWDGVTLSLVAGRPVSFVMDLYEPLFLSRPKVPVPVVSAADPKVFERADMARRIAGRTMMDGETAAEESLMAPALRGLENDTGGVYAFGAGAPQPVATAGESGEVFFYELDQPVTVERRRSAMLPILNAPVTAERISIYNPRENASNGHPMRGAQVENTSDLKLLPGPIAVFDGAAYAGDAQIGYMNAGETRLLAYAVDLDMTVRTENRVDQRVTSVKIVDGLMVQTTSQEARTDYKALNADQKRDRTLLVEHPKRSADWELVSPSVADGTVGETPSLRRFEVEVPAGGDSTLTVRERRTLSTRTELVNANVPYLLSIQRSAGISERVMEAIQEAQRLNGLVLEAQRRISGLERERDDIGREQGRIRENLKSVPDQSELQRRYLRTLSTQEDRLETIATHIGDWQRELRERQTALREYLRDLDIE